MVKRFVERFKIWTSEVAGEFEDKFARWLLVLVVFFVASDGYTFFTTHHLSRSSVFGTTVFTLFAILYIRRARLTWIPLMILAISFLYSLRDYQLFSKAGHIGAKIFAVVFVLVLGGAAFMFSLILRKRFANCTRSI